ncbi:MAG: glycoside hydrolase family 95 protein [Nonomuraea sp.]|nr:glycoside hydrolase family 95 protein [Nonomuraea sp.]
MLTLWYDEPAPAWEGHVLPIGNGALGACVYGTVDTERIQLNEKTLWTGGPGGEEPYDFGRWPQDRRAALDAVRRAIDERGSVPPEEAADLLGNPSYSTVGRIPGFGAYQNFGELLFDVPGGFSGGYRRSLDLETAVASVTYEDADGVPVTREYFASYPANVIVGRITGGFTLRFASTRQASVTAEGGRLRIRGTLAGNGMVYEGQVQVVPQGGTRTDEGDRVVVTGAGSTMFVFSAGTDYAPVHPHYRGEDPAARVTAAVDAAASRTYEDLRAEHEADHRALFGRVRLDLGRRAPALPTDRLLAAYTGTGTPADKALETLYFQYGRYLLIAASRPGSLPANLQGVWNDSDSPPWDGDYHTNINLQMNYWPAEPANLAETALPYHEFVEALRAPGRESAKAMFGSEGWVVHSNTNPFGFTGVHDWPTSFWMPDAAGWLVRHLYDRYLFDGDERFLRERAYPAMREAAEFWLANLCTDPRDGTLVVSPGYSPEHGDFTAGPAMPQQIVWDLFTSTAQAARTLGVDAEFGERLRAALDRLDPGLRVGSWGQLQEWKADLDDPADEHRHVSHLYALHPGTRLTAPEHLDAARVTLEARGDGGTGWSRAWKINFWARLRDGDRALRMLSGQLESSTLPNLWDTHPPFQIDGNFGATAGMAEMLLQSHAGVIELLPALPRAWDAGSYDGLRARGGFTVGVTWADGVPTEVRLSSARGGTARLRGPGFTLDVATAAGESYVLSPAR